MPLRLLIKQEGQLLLWRVDRTAYIRLSVAERRRFLRATTVLYMPCWCCHLLQSSYSKILLCHIKSTGWAKKPDLFERW